MELELIYSLLSGKVKKIKLFKTAMPVLFSLLFFSCSPTVPGDPVNTVPHGLQAVKIDGMPYDWGGVASLAAASGQSSEKLKVAHDSDYLYISVHGKGMSGFYHLFLETDDNITTGFQGKSWAAFGFEYMVENGFLWQSSGPAWGDFVIIGSENILDEVNSDVYEIRIKKSALTDAGNVIRIGFREIDAGYALISDLPSAGFPPAYSMSAGYDLTGAVDLLKVIIPAYFDPLANPADWNRITAKASSMPGRIFAIANPDNGPGTAVDSSYTGVIDNLRNSGGRTLGYVHTLYGSRDINLVKADIDSWYSFYNIDGIFLDEQAGSPGYEDHYLEIYNYIKSKRPAALVVGNPGVTPSETYLFNNGNRVTDVICIFENETGYLEWDAPEWVFHYESENFCVLTIQTPHPDHKVFTDHAAANNAGWVYHTDDPLPNPWDVLSSYFEEICEYIR